MPTALTLIVALVLLTGGWTGCASHLTALDADGTTLPPHPLVHFCFTATNVMSGTLRVPWQLLWGSAPSQLLYRCFTTTSVMSGTPRVPWQLLWGSAPSQLLYRCFTTTNVMSSYTF